jgi:hypothetical protein
MISIDELNRILTRHFTRSFPEPGQSYEVLIHDCAAVRVTSIDELDQIVQLHLPDALLTQYERIRRHGEIVHALNPDAPPHKREPAVIGVVRKCFENHFGIDWIVAFNRANAAAPVGEYALQQVPSPLAATRLPNELFKYTTSGTAQIVLKSGKIRLNSPLNFNDRKDLRTNPKLPDNEDELVELISKRREELVFSDTPPSGMKDNVTYQLNSLVRAVRAPTTTREKFRARNLESYKASAKAIRVDHANVRKFWNHWAKYFRVLCLSESKNSPKLWHEYAEDHAGVMLVFNPRRFAPPLLHWAKVEYSPEPPELISAAEVIDNALGISSYDKPQRVSRLCFVKHTLWGHEAEWRCVLLRSDWNHHPLESTLNENLNDDVPFPKESLSAVHIGLNCPEAQRAAIVSLIKENYPGTSIFQAEDDDSSFQPRFKKIA